MKMGIQRIETHRIAAAIVEAALLGAGLGLILCAGLADKIWLDRHVLPHMFLSRDLQLLWWMVGRAAAVVAGLLILYARPWVVRSVRSGRGRELAMQGALIVVAILLSGVASEAVLRTTLWHRVDQRFASEEPMRQPDPHLGWVNRPGRTGFESFDGQRIFYAFDADGRRVARAGAAIDPARPSILFTGESVMLGFRLNWPETIAGRVEALTGLQSVNLAVNGYGTDQSFMRIQAELPRFVTPSAVVILFAPTLLERDLEEDRPHLDAALRWHPAPPDERLRRVARNVVLYHSIGEIDDAIARTRAVLQATVRAARARHAAVLILVPGFVPEAPAEPEIRRRVLEDPALPFVTVALNPNWRIAHDGHPDAKANLAMARAIIAGLARQRPDLFGTPKAGAN